MGAYLRYKESMRDQGVDVDEWDDLEESVRVAWGVIDERIEKLEGRVRVLRDALICHQEQTRPIQVTIDALKGE